MLPKMSFTATGDSIIRKRLTNYPGFEEIQKEINRGDMRFFNLETTVHDYESYASQFSGGGWLCAPKECLDDCRKFGFNVTTIANNHSLDFSYMGLELTLENIKNAGFPCAGAGLNLEQASSPVYIDCPQGRAALIAVTSAFHPSAMAGEQTRSMIGRPGVNGLRHDTVRYLDTEHAEMARELAAVSGVNNLLQIGRKLGYVPLLPEGRIEFENITFMEGDKNEVKTFCKKADLERVKQAILEAELQADYIIISMHTHEYKGEDMTVPPQFAEEFARFCIDSGAHAVVGHGPHVIWPMEIYHGKPIFYSLGDFIFHNENMTKVPADFCTIVGMDPNSGVRDVLSARSRGFTVGWQNTPEAFETIIPYWEMDDGQLTKLTLLAAELGYGEPRSRGGWPKPAGNSRILERLAQISVEYGIEMRIEGDRGEVIL